MGSVGFVVVAAGAVGFAVVAAGFVAGGGVGFVVGAGGFAVAGFCVAGLAGGVCAVRGDAAKANTHNRLSSDLVMSNSSAATGRRLRATGHQLPARMSS
jgi:hypothetical protein